MKNPRAFTLVEVILVVAILAALAAILFPVLNRAKKSGNEAVCVQRLRQKHLAQTLYREQWNGVEMGTPSQMGLSFDLSGYLLYGKEAPGYSSYAKCTARIGHQGESYTHELHFLQSWPELDGFDADAPARWELKKGGPYWFEMLEALGNQSPMYIDPFHPDQFPVSPRSLNRAFAVTLDGNLVKRRRVGMPGDIRFWYR